MRDIVLIAHDIRSTHNVGSLLRTAEGLGVSKVFLTGFTPFPVKKNDSRLPHLSAKIDKQIAKTALGAEKSSFWEQSDDILPVLSWLSDEGYTMCALEQSADAVQLSEYNPPEKLALLIGREVEGIEPKLLKKCDVIIEIPMFGKKESFNVVQAAAMALYHFRFKDKTF